MEISGFMRTGWRHCAERDCGRRRCRIPGQASASPGIEPEGSASSRSGARRHRLIVERSGAMMSIPTGGAEDDAFPGGVHPGTRVTSIQICGNGVCPAR